MDICDSLIFSWMVENPYVSNGCLGILNCLIDFFGTHSFSSGVGGILNCLVDCLESSFLVVCLEAEERVDVFFEMEYCLDELLNSLVKITRQNRKGFRCVKISRFPRTVSGKINYNDLRKEQNEFRL